jgi:hypothetical protein
MKFIFKYLSFLSIFISTILFAAVPTDNVKDYLENYYLITEKGLPGKVAIGMTLKDLQRMGITYEDISHDEEYIPELGRHYRVDSLGIEFNIMDTQIIGYVPILLTD